MLIAFLKICNKVFIKASFKNFCEKSGDLTCSRYGELVKYATNNKRLTTAIILDYALPRKIITLEYGRSDLTFPEAFSSCFFPPEILHMKSPDMPEIFL
jgi:hypothetical protein